MEKELPRDIWEVEKQAFEDGFDFCARIIYDWYLKGGILFANAEVQKSFVKDLLNKYVEKKTKIS